jgi:hypothetical protein
MVRIIKEYRVLIIITLLLVAFGLVLWWPRPEEKNTNTKVTPVSKIAGMRQKPAAVEWGDTEIVVPQKTSILRSNSSFINGDKLERLKKELGMEGVGATKSNSYYVVYENKEATLYIKLRERQIDYLIKQKLSYKGEKDKSKALVSFQNLISKTTGRPVGQIEVEYFRDEFRAVRSNMNNADFMEISANFLYKDNPVMSMRGGPSVKAQYGFDGKLGRLIMYNPFDELVEDREVELIDKDTLKNLGGERTFLFEIKGNREFAMSTGEEEVGTIRATSATVAYLYEPSDNSYVPFIVGQGKTWLKSGETKVVIGSSLLKQ